MSELTTKEKLKLVLQLCEKHHITAYEIGENTGLNTSGVHRILTGAVENPRPRTVSTILEYIEGKIVGKDVDKSHESTGNHISESGEIATYQASIQNMIAKEVVRQLEPYLKKFNKSHNDINRFLLENGIEIDDIKDELDDIKKSVEEMHEVLVPKKTK